jgi:tRNA threonylcarbamoyl adenosine modification protein YeaZ
LPPNPTILAFDTSAAHCAAALLLNGEVHTLVEEMARGQGERLMVLLEEVLAEHEQVWADLDAIGVGTGPGNFTGIRIAVSAARGLALGLGVPAIGVSNFEAVAYQIPNAVACLPAPRGQAYVQSFVAHSDQNPRLVDLADRDTLQSIPGKAEPRFCGPAAREVADLYSYGSLGWSKLAPIEAVARIAEARLHSTTERPTPLYVRPADAAPPREKPPVILP